MQLSLPLPLPQPPHEAYESKTYRAEFYKGSSSLSGAIGILKRQKGAKTLMYIGSLKHGETELRGLADSCLQKLDKGDDVDAVKKWGLEQLK
jgi:hypothetical protein